MLSHPIRVSTNCAPASTCVEEPQFTRDYHDPDKRSIANSLRVELDNGEILEETVEYPIGHRRRRERRPAAAGGEIQNQPPPPLP